MATNQNDIVINAKAQTKEAEAGIKQLDAKIKSLTASDPKLQQLGTRLGNVGGKVINQEKVISGGFAALQGNLTGVITKLGAVGLAIGALKKVWDAYWSAEQKNIDAMKSSAEASGTYLNTLQDSTKSILKNLESLDKFAEGGFLDGAAIEKINSLVRQLNELWGDVGITVDQTTGKINGLAEATKKITGELRDMAIRQAKMEEWAAQAEVDKAKSDYSREFDENGERTWFGNLRLAANLENLGEFAIKGGGAKAKDEITKRRRSELEGAVKTANARLMAAQQKRKALETGTTQDDINAIIATGQAAQGQDSAAAAKAAKDAEAERQRLIEEEEKAYEAEQQRLKAQTEYIEQARKNIAQFDAEEERLKQELAIAQANGGDVEGAKTALDNYIEQRSRARLAELQGQLGDARWEQRESQRRYNQDVEVGADDDVIEASLKRLEAANAKVAQITGEMNRLASGVYKPAEAPVTETTKIAKAMTNGTFNSFGVGGLSYQNIEKEQLEVQKEIAKNTRNLGAPVVAE